MATNIHLDRCGARFILQHDHSASSSSAIGFFTSTPAPPSDLPPLPFIMKAPTPTTKIPTTAIATGGIPPSSPPPSLVPVPAVVAPVSAGTEATGSAPAPAPAPAPGPVPGPVPGPAPGSGAGPGAGPGEVVGGVGVGVGVGAGVAGQAPSPWLHAMVAPSDAGHALPARTWVVVTEKTLSAQSEPQMAVDQAPTQSRSTHPPSPEVQMKTSP